MKRYYSDPITQKQINLTYHSDTHTERSVCPFCHTETIGEYTKINGTEWLETKQSCNHFQGFIQGHHTPTSFYKGMSSMLE